MYHPIMAGDYVLQEKQTPSVDQKMFKCEYEGCGKIYATLHHLQVRKIIRGSHLLLLPFCT